LTLTCDEALTFVATNLAYSNNETGACLIEGSVLGVITGSLDECQGTLTQTWTYTDDCGRTIEATQTITIEPAPIAVFDAVTPLTLTCDEALTFVATNLAYSNNETGACLIEGSVLGVITGSFDECQGTLTQTWTDREDTGMNSRHAQTTNAEPGSKEEIDAVTPLTLTC